MFPDVILYAGVYNLAVIHFELGVVRKNCCVRIQPQRSIHKMPQVFLSG
jgi:hypothetical protein